MKRKEGLLSQISAVEDIQDTIKHTSTKEKVCIVTIDYASLTTKCEDPKAFLK
ncbi:hypothetical protein RO3G_01020 [Rhizopus delemar RA 99-880]|uniref:Uncharacterized protein n=1 Tax=Rhizopus delemar (strain RA 99-880 / ATCC MYA-4621 / FGSC 9543 / NRRL 43880) TaxID=246409 RepID=I1BJD6_RHIO9|nr:hypothetical protein RO3G_01020 [Rhizopus delemar RA 99-880]|eukprot:EIE76316.1 hypothetical protein RO3G_01020 [Rhizopus delemar RA 99-880]